MTLLKSVEAFLWFVTYLAFGLALLAVFARLYFVITPHDDMAMIHDGKVAPAVALGGAMLGFTFPLLTASYLHETFFGFLIWATIACLVQLGVFRAIYLFMPRAIETNNVAGGTVYAFAAVCAGLLNAASFIP
jgi:putative membrane protein